MPKVNYAGRTHPENYIPGCDCTACIGRRAYSRAYRAERKVLAKTNPELVPHGTPNGSKNWGCKCVPCSTARAAYDKNYRRTRHRRDPIPIVPTIPTFSIVSRPISV